jgi:hypothetical protein
LLLLLDLPERDTQAHSARFAKLRIHVAKPIEALEDTRLLVQQADRHPGARSTSAMMSDLSACLTFVLENDVLSEKDYGL